MGRAQKRKQQRGLPKPDLEKLREELAPMGADAEPWLRLAEHLYALRTYQEAHYRDSVFALLQAEGYVVTEIR